MEARLHAWRLKIKKHPVASILVASFIVLGVLVLVGGYKFNWAWTGFNGVKVTYKTLYDWLQLLIIPAVLAVAGYIINLTISRGEQAATEQRAKSEREAAEKHAETERQIAKERYEQDKVIASRHYHQDREIARQRYEQDQQLALDKQRQDLLQVYLDRMSELLLEKGLRTSQADAEVRNVARTRTISVLRQLDAVRVGDVFTFLIEARLMETPEPIVRLGDANLSKVNWSEADLTDANLSVANLSGANLSNAFLEKADLSNAHVWGANLSGAGLMEADLSGADLSTTDLRSADLSNADLSNAKVTEEQLKAAQSLEGATMPDGSIHP